MTDEVKNYIEQLKAAGQTDDQIRASLKQVGWTDNQIQPYLPIKQAKVSDKMVMMIIMVVIVVAACSAGAYFLFWNNGDTDKPVMNKEDDSETILVDLSTDRFAVMYEKTISIVNLSGSESEEKEIYRFIDEGEEFWPYNQGTRELLTDGEVLFVVYGSTIDKIDFEGERLGRWNRSKSDREKERDARNANKVSYRDIEVTNRVQQNFEVETVSHKFAQVDIDSLTSGRGWMISSAVLYEKYLFVSANGEFIVMDKDFKLKAKVDLELGKNADDILVYKDRALLVDNIWEPYYVITIDISDPEAPRGVSWHGSGGANTGLGNQWTDEDGNWYVEGSYSTMGGWGSWVSQFQPAVYENDKPYESVNYDDVYDDYGESGFGKEMVIAEGSSYDSGSNSDARGYYISADLNHFEDYFVIMDVQNRSFALTHIDKNFRLVDPITLGSGEDYGGWVVMHRIGDEIVVSSGKHLIHIDDAGNKPAIKSEQKFSDSILDFVPLPR